MEPTIPTERDSGAAAVAAPTRAEHVADMAIHALGVIGSIVAVTVMLVLAVVWHDGWTVLTISIYGIGVVAVFVISAVYHAAPDSPSKHVLRRCDHAAIFVKIAGTYTPFAALSIGGGWGFALLGSVWGIAAVGVPLKLAGWRRAEWLAIALYLVQGWLVLIAIGPVSAALGPVALGLCLAGGILYTLGVAFYLADRLPFNTAIWHGFVLAASACMYAAVMEAIVLG